MLELDRVLFIPAAQQPLKAGDAIEPADGGVSRAAPAERLEMVECAIAGDARFAVSPIEIDRGGLSFTVDTLSELAARSPGDTRYLWVGADVLATFAKWRQPERILELATLAVFTRSVGDATDARSLWADFSEQWRAVHGTNPAHQPVFLASRRVDVSSTEVRQRIAANRPIHGFVPDAVAKYVAERGLYR